MNNDDELCKGGCGRCADEIIRDAKFFLFCIVLALLLAGCCCTERGAAKELRRNFNGL